MAGNSYPHIIFAKDAQVLPQQSLAEVLTDLFPGAEVEQGEIKAVLRLPGYAYTFWYDDDADGLGDRYADFAAPLRRKRVTRCTTMIDASGDADPGGAHAVDVARLMDDLAARDGVYVFSEETKRFLGMDYDAPAQASTPAASATTSAGAGVFTPAGAPPEPPVADAEDTMIADVAASTGQREEEFVSPLERSTTPAADLQSTYSSPAHVDEEQAEVVLASRENDHDVRHTEHHPVDASVPPAPTGTEVPDTTPGREEDRSDRPEDRADVAPAAPAATTDHAGPTDHVEPRPAPTPAAAEAPTTPTVEAPVEPRPEPRPAPTPEAVREPVREPAAADSRAATATPTGEEEGKPGFFKRLFKRKD